MASCTHPNETRSVTSGGNSRHCCSSTSARGASKRSGSTRACKLRSRKVSGTYAYRRSEGRFRYADSPSSTDSECELRRSRIRMGSEEHIGRADGKYSRVVSGGNFLAAVDFGDAESVSA